MSYAATIKAKYLLPLVFAASTATADEAAQLLPFPRLDLYPKNLSYAYKPDTKPSERIADIPATEVLAQSSLKDNAGLFKSDKVRLIESVKESIGLGSWEINEQYEGLTRELFTLPVSFSKTRFDMKFQFMVARDGNGDIPAPYGMERLFRNDRPTTVGLQFRIPIETGPKKTL